SVVTVAPRTVITAEWPLAMKPTSSPSSSTIPVNMGSVLSQGFGRCRRCPWRGVRRAGPVAGRAGQAEVGADPGDVGEVEVDGLGEGAHASVGQRGGTGAEQHRRDVADDAVDEALPQERAGQGGPALQQRVPDASLVEGLG